MFLADVVVDEADARRPDFIETNATGSGLDDFALAERLLERGELLEVLGGEIFAFVTENGVFAVVGVTDADPLVVFDLVRCKGKFNFGRIIKERHMLFFFAIFLSAGTCPC